MTSRKLCINLNKKMFFIDCFSRVISKRALRVFLMQFELFELEMFSESFQNQFQHNLQNPLKDNRRSRNNFLVNAHRYKVENPFKKLKLFSQILEKFQFLLIACRRIVKTLKKNCFMSRRCRLIPKRTPNNVLSMLSCIFAEFLRMVQMKNDPYASAKKLKNEPFTNQNFCLIWKTVRKAEVFYTNL